MKDELIIDCFAGGGGASVGIEMALGRPVDIAINHDPEAIRMHKVNHPDTIHLTEDIFKVDLQKYVKGRKVALMWASPDCTSHSKAKGGQPRRKGLRILPWAVYKHAKQILPEVIIMENVEEIQQWGPLDEKGHPIKERQGEDYKKFITAMKNLGYVFDSRELVAADYGAPTTRKRWYAIFRRDGKDIIWPEQTYFKDREPKWKQCGDYIDWSDLGKSIFGRKKQLAEATQKRIANGIRKYILENPEPYIVKNDDAVAFLIQYHGEQKTGESRGQLLSEPIKTIDTKYIAKAGGSGIIKSKSVNEENSVAEIRNLGKINIKVLEKEFGKIQTDEIIVTNERIDHIKERHPEDYNLFEKYGKESVSSPDLIIKDMKNKGTVFMVKKLPETNLNVVVRVVLETDDSKLKNSVMTFYRIRERNLKKLIEKNGMLYKKE